MNTKLANRKFNKMFVNILSILVILAMVFPITTVAYAAPNSPFLGHWEAIDVDGSDMGLSIAGRPGGPFQITWIDDYISYCNGEAGIVRGTGWLNEADSSLLEADVLLECFITGAMLDFHVTFRYHPATNTLSIKYGFGQVTIWHRPGGGQVQEPPVLNLRVNYGNDWVESFYEGGHTAWVTVTESDGVTVKATAELVTEPKWYWGGETGFQSLDSAWFNLDGNQMENPPDIQPNDWVYGWVDNGASALVQIGDIGGMIDLANESIEGTIMAPWFSNTVQVECLDWGSGQEPPFNNKDGGFVYTNGADPYSCSWYGEWDIQPNQNVGVGYFGPDGHWVANAFFARNPRIVASEAGNWFWTTEFEPGMLDLFVYASADEGATLLWSGQQEADQWGFTIVGYDIHTLDLVPANYLVVSDGVNQKGLVLQAISVTVFDTVHEIMAGIAPPGSEVWAAAGPMEWQERLMVQADPVSGAWLADFTTIGFDITEDMRPSSYAHIYDEDGDANEGSTPPPPPDPTFVAYMPATIVGYGWPLGDTVVININNGEYTAQSTVGNADWDPNIVLFELWRDDFIMEAGDQIVMTDEVAGITKDVVVTNLAVTDANLGMRTVSGIYDAAYSLWVWLYGEDGQVPATDPIAGTWTATFTELPPRAWGGATQWDVDGDGTSIDFQAPNPNLYALADEDKIFANEWIAGFNLELTIYNSIGEVLHTNSKMVDPPSEVPWTLVVFEGFNIEPGQRIVLNQRGYERELIVSSLMITEFDLANQQVIGIGDTGAQIFIRINGEDVWGEVGTDGSWAISHPQLAPGVWGEAIQPDGIDGDETRDGFQAPNPNLYALPDQNKIFAQGWIAGFALELKIYNSVGEEILSDSQMVEPPTVAPWTVAIFDLGRNGFDLLPEHRIVLNQRGYQRELVVSSLRITGFDYSTKQVVGTGDIGAHIFVRINGKDVWGEVDSVGNWAISHPQLAPGVWGEAIQPDGIDGDETRDGFQAPNE